MKNLNKLFPIIRELVRQHEDKNKSEADLLRLHLKIGDESFIVMNSKGEYITQAGDEMEVGILSDKLKKINKKTMDKHISDLKKGLVVQVKEIGFHIVAGYGISKGTLSRLLKNEDLQIATLFKIQFLIEKHKKNS